MKVFILHLSDMHFDKLGGYKDENVKKIVNAFQNQTKFIEHLFIIISGDLAYSGKGIEYKHVEKFIDALKLKIKEKIKINNIDLIIVPGNHDLDYTVGEKLSSSALQNIVKESRHDALLDKECLKLKNYKEFSKKYKCDFENRKLVKVLKFKVHDKMMRFNLINTAVFSSLDEDQGGHFISDDDINLLSDTDDAEFIFTVMHHPHHWFCWQVKKKLEVVLYERCDAIFVGHEHYSTVQQIGSNDADVKIYAGGELSNCSAWTKSEFFAGTIDLDNREFDVKKYVCDNENKVYSVIEKGINKIKKNRLNILNIRPKNEYINELIKDRYNICADFTRYYVFPLLEECVRETSKNSYEINDLNKFLHQIKKKCMIYIKGRSNCGKTALMRIIAKKIIENKVLIYLNARDIRGKKFNTYIKERFCDIYTEDNAKWEEFVQLLKEYKWIIIDDIDDLDVSLTSEFLDYLHDNFKYIVLTGSNKLELDLKKGVIKESLLNDFTVYKMHSFYEDKRLELVSRIINLKNNSDMVTKNHVIDVLCDGLTNQKGLFVLDPDFIIQFTMYYCTHIGEVVQNDGEIFSKVFEANITSMITPLLKNISVDKMFIILDKIAYKMHVEKKSVCDSMLLSNVINEYNMEYDSNVDAIKFVEKLVRAEILKRDKNQYWFAQKNFLAYFVAREIKRKCSEEKDYTEFDKALRFACFGINSNIIMFVTYITDDINFIRKIQQIVETDMRTWDKFSVNPITIQYLKDIKPIEIKTVDDNDRTMEMRKSVEYERNIEEHRDLDKLEEIYNYEENDLKELDKLIRSISLMTIIARTLPSFEHMMKKLDKNKCVDLIYNLPLRIFNVWANILNDNKHEIIEEIQRLEEYSYRKDKRFSSTNEVLCYLRWESMSLLLDLMNASMGYATKANTYEFLDRYEYKRDELYRIEHLMVIEKRDKVDDFSKEVCDIYKNVKGLFVKLMIQRVTYHFMCKSRNINQSEIQRLNSKILESKIRNSKLLYNKVRNRTE